MTNRENDTLGKAATMASTGALAAAAAASAAEAEDKFLAGIRSDDEDANYAAWSTADQVDPGVIPAVSELLTSKKPNVRNAVGKTINAANLGANVGRPDATGKMDTRQVVVMHLLGLLDGKRQEIEKTTALRHLSLIATSDAVDKIAMFVNDPILREEAVFCLERIPGKTSEETLMSVLSSAADDFKPRILGALGHRRAEEAVEACIEAMQSSDTAIAIAGMKAWARIGTSTGEEIEFPDYDSLNTWQKVEFDDSLLRYADAQVEKGNHTEAQAIYMQTLDRDQEHLQCAAIVGLAKIGTAEAAAAIFPKLESANDKVRITARQAWARMAGIGDGS